MSQPFRNWARTVESRPAAWARPTSEKQIATIVRHVRDRRGRLKVCGARHSWSDIAAGTDIQMDLTELERVISVDRNAKRVTAAAGCPLHVLLDVLASHGLAMPVLGSISEQTLAGLTATATHGSTLRVGNISSLVEGMRLVTGTGEVLDLGPDDPRLPGARVHLGALGVITQLTLKVRDAFRLEERREVMPFDAAAERIHDICKEHAFAKLWWLPHTDDAMIFTYDETEAAGERSAVAWAVDGWVNNRAFPALLQVGRTFPNVIPRINRVVNKVHFTPSVRRGRSDHMLQLVMPPRHREAEIAFDAIHTAEVLRATRDVVHADGARVDFIVELRFVKGDHNWMSPAFGRDTCQLLIGGTHSPDIDRVFDAFQSMGALYDARPHWGKELRLTPERVTQLYPHADDFRALARTFDPDGVFRNPFLDAVLGAP